MSVFKSEKLIPIHLADLNPTAEDLMAHFRLQGFEVTGTQTLTGGCDVSIHKGGLFKAVLGMKTALKVSLEPMAQGTLVKAGVGIFGQQVIPTVIMLFLFWPVILTQIWGLVQQAKLDDEVVAVVEHSLSTRGGTKPREVAHTVMARPSASPQFCTQCGAALPIRAKFCAECGRQQ